MRRPAEAAAATSPLASCSLPAPLATPRSHWPGSASRRRRRGRSRAARRRATAPYCPCSCASSARRAARRAPPPPPAAARGATRRAPPRRRRAAGRSARRRPGATRAAAPGRRGAAAAVGRGARPNSRASPGEQVPPVGSKVRPHSSRPRSHLHEAPSAPEPTRRCLGLLRPRLSVQRRPAGRRARCCNLQVHLVERDAEDDLPDALGRRRLAPRVSVARERRRRAARCTWPRKAARADVERRALSLVAFHEASLASELGRGAGLLRPARSLQRGRRRARR